MSKLIGPTTRLSISPAQTAILVQADPPETLSQHDVGDRALQDVLAACLWRVCLNRDGGSQIGEEHNRSHKTRSLMS